MFNVSDLRKEFPIVNSMVKQKPLVYFDNAATTQKPQVVINAVKDFYTSSNANIHRGVYALSVKATNLYEDARKNVQKFINASNANEIVFCRGATEAINLVAHSFVKPKLNSGDEILLSQMEHHANIVPWHIIAKETGAVIKVIPINNEGDLVLEELDNLLTDKTRIVAISHVSNALGTINPIKKIIARAHDKQIPVLIDGAQAMTHAQVDVQELDCEFYCFSGHKTYGPTGIGVLYGKYALLSAMQPYQGGGEMIKTVAFDKVEYADVPNRFEAGTPNIAGAIGLGAALNYIRDIGIDNIINHEHKLLEYFNAKLSDFPEFKIIGNATQKAGIISFILDNIHAHDIATIMDEHGIAIRAGHHCAMPVMNFYKIPATARVSFGVYNTEQEIEQFFATLSIANRIFQ